MVIAFPSRGQVDDNGVCNKRTGFQEMTVTYLEEEGDCVYRNIPETDVITAELQGSVYRIICREILN
jgi:hypothetical protein